jgi:hypothetical protein
MRAINRLSARTIVSVGVGIHCDGGGLYIQVTRGKDGSTLHRSWLFRFGINGRDRMMGLGSFPTVSIAEAREKAAHARKLVASHTVPSSIGTLCGLPARLPQPSA